MAIFGWLTEKEALHYTAGYDREETAAVSWSGSRRRAAQVSAALGRAVGDSPAQPKEPAWEVHPSGFFFGVNAAK